MKQPVKGSFIPPRIAKAPSAALAVPLIIASSPTSSSGGLSVALWVLLLVSATFLLIAALPSEVTYRVSEPVGRAISGARMPLLASALAVTVGLAVGLVLNG